MQSNDTLRAQLDEMRSKLLVYVNGRFVKANEPAISAFDHGLLYGDGVYEAIRKYGDKIFMLEEHIERLYESAKTVRINIPYTKEELARIVKQTVEKNALKDAYIRIIITRGYGKMGVDPRGCVEPTVLVMAEPREPIFSVKGVRAKIVSIRRIPQQCIDPKAKTLNYLNHILAKIEALESGFDEAIMLNEQGFVSEASTENVFIAKKGMVATPPLSAGILDGITRRVVIRLAKELGIQVSEVNLTPHDLYNADEVFLTGTAAEVVPVVCVDGVKIGSGEAGPVFRRIREAFETLVRN